MFTKETIVLLFCSSTFASHLRLDPHYYSGPRGSEGRQQFVIQAFKSWENAREKKDHWKISFHYEGEAAGRRNMALDLDQAWYQFNVSGSKITLGRIHPWYISSHPQTQYPWGYLAHHHSQNRGLALGYGYDGTNTPSPTLSGWMGFHFFSQLSEDLNWGISATPFFIPSMGSLSSVEDLNQVGRFGRRPPGTVEINGSKFPIRYQLTKSQIFEDIVLQPQAMGQVHWKNHPHWPGWWSISYTPTPNPAVDTDGYLSLESGGIEAVAIVTPKFPYRWKTDLHQRWSLSKESYLMASLLWASNYIWGYEMGIGTNFYQISLLNEQAWGPVDLNYQGDYSEWLLQADVQLILSKLTWYGGIKQHLERWGQWIRSGVKFQLWRQASVDLSLDIFGGNEQSYYGEWRTNDRASAVFTWRFDE